MTTIEQLEKEASRTGAIICRDEDCRVRGPHFHLDHWFHDNKDKLEKAYDEVFNG